MSFTAVMKKLFEGRAARETRLADERNIIERQKSEERQKMLRDYFRELAPPEGSDVDRFHNELEVNRRVTLQTPSAAVYTSTGEPLYRPIQLIASNKLGLSKRLDNIESFPLARARCGELFDLGFDLIEFIATDRSGAPRKLGYVNSLGDQQFDISRLGP